MSETAKATAMNGNTQTANPGDPNAVLTEADAILDGPPPHDIGVAAGSLREWIDLSRLAENWPQPSAIAPIPSYYWQQTKAHVTHIANVLRSPALADQIDATTRSGLLSALHSFLQLGAIYTTNAMQAVQGNPEEREIRYDIDDKMRAEVVKSIVDGWMPADAPGRTLPGLMELFQSSDKYAPKSLGSMNTYFKLIDYRLAKLENRPAVRAPVYIRRLVSEPSIVTVGASVKFTIHYYSKHRTIRDAIIRLAGRSRPAESGPSGRKDFWALRDINFTAHPGDVVGIVGANGSGKTTFLKTLAGILGPDRGTVTVKGKVGCLLSFGVGFNANLSGRENVYLNGSILGLSQRDIRERMEAIIEFSELRDFIDAPVRTYSAGMRGRLGFSIAIHIDPDVLILDEVLTVGDAYFRDKAGSIIDKFQNENKTVVVASHSMNLIREKCSKAVWLDKGTIRMEGDPDDVVRAYVAGCRSASSMNDE